MMKVIIEANLGEGGVVLGAGMKDGKTPFISFEAAKERHQVGEPLKDDAVNVEMPKVYVTFGNVEGFEALQQLMDWCYQKLQAKEE